VRLGTARGVCGRLTTSLRRLFPLRARPGTWRLQFDTRKRSHRGTARSTFLYYTLAVRISRPRR
jgi:hypothetical protein